MFPRVSISVPRVSIDGEPHGTLALVMSLSGLVIATIIIAIIAILLRKANRIEWEKMKTLTKLPPNNIDAVAPLEAVVVTGSSTEATASNSMKPVIESETIESVLICEAIGPSSHVMDRPKVGIFTIFGSTKQSFDLN